MTEQRPSRALVLGGGGIAGIAWELGLLAGLAGPASGEPGVDVTGADLVVGTSAGSVVGALLRSGTPLADLAAGQLAPASGTEVDVAFDATEMMTAFARALAGVTDQQEARARIGDLALGAATVPEAERRAVIAGRLGGAAWPDRPLTVTAVDTADGAFTTFDRASGVPLLDAVAASCAVPGVWPPITVGDRRYMDGGMRSATNADLAAGTDRVLVVAPTAGFPESPLGPTLEAEVATLRAAGAQVHVVVADARALAAFGTNPLSPRTREPSARAGTEQAADELAAVRELWG